MVDARYEHVRVDGRVMSQGELIVKGVGADRQRELLAVDVADSESDAAYDALFRRLKEHGLRGVRLVTSGRSPRPGERHPALLPGRSLATLPGALPA